MVERRAVNRGDGVQSHLPPFRNLGNFFTPHLPVSFGRTLKAGGPFYLVSMPGDIKDPTQGCVTSSGLTNSTEEQLLR